MQQELSGELLLELKSIVLSYIKEFTQYHRPYGSDFEAIKMSSEALKPVRPVKLVKHKTSKASEAGEDNKTGEKNPFKDFAGSFNYFQPQLLL